MHKTYLKINACLTEKSINAKYNIAQAKIADLDSPILRKRISHIEQLECCKVKASGDNN